MLASAGEQIDVLMFNNSSELAKRVDAGLVTPVDSFMEEEGVQMDEECNNAFPRLYKQQTGETFIGYVTKEKMNRAKELLDQTERTVEEIADLLGYEHKSYFVKTFKKQYGIPPKEYRSRLIVD